MNIEDFNYQYDILIERGYPACDNLSTALFYIQDHYNHTPLDMVMYYDDFLTKWFPEWLAEFDIYDSGSNQQFYSRVDDYFDVYTRYSRRPKMIFNSIAPPPEEDPDRLRFSFYVQNGNLFLYREDETEIDAALMEGSNVVSPTAPLDPVDPYNRQLKITHAEALKFKINASQPEPQVGDDRYLYKED